MRTVCSNSCPWSQSKAEEVCVQLSGDYEEQLEAVSPYMYIVPSLSYIVDGVPIHTVVHLRDCIQCIVISHPF